MFLAQLKNELWKLFGKKRTYIGFGAFVLAQTAMLLMFKYTHWQSQFERLLAGNGYLASEYISALTVALVMLWPQLALLMPLYVTLVGGDLVAKEVEDGTLRMILSRPISRVSAAAGKMAGGNDFFGGIDAGIGRHCAGFCAPLFSLERNVRVWPSSLKAQPSAFSRRVKGWRCMPFPICSWP